MQVFLFGLFKSDRVEFVVVMDHTVCELGKVCVKGWTNELMIDNSMPAGWYTGPVTVYWNCQRLSRALSNFC